MKTKLREILASKKKGQSLVEYGLILALVSVVAIGVLTSMGDQIRETVSTVTNSLENATQAGQDGAGQT